jgi:hypothetical protein
MISISYITVRVKILVKSETIEAKIEQKSRTNVDTIKSVCYLVRINQSHHFLFF